MPTNKKMKEFDTKYQVQTISHAEADAFLIRHHYLAQQGNGFVCKTAHGLFDKQLHLIGCITWGGVSVFQTLIGCFDGYERFSDQEGIWELTRLAMDDRKKEPNLTSWFVSHSIKKLRKENNVKAIISYADSAYHHGYIYQATNFKYYGLTAKKTDFFEIGQDGKRRQVWRGPVKDLNGEWVDRTRKHRYMIIYDKSLKTKWKEEPYPKGNNDEYLLSVPNKNQISIFDII